MTLLSKLMQRAVQKDASDIHVKLGGPAYFRIDGQLLPQDSKSLIAEDIEIMVDALLNETQKKFFMKKGEIDKELMKVITVF